MDIKDLLLMSLSSKKPISGCRRLQFGKSCFHIRFEVRGKYMKITRIRKTLRKQLTLRQRIKRRYLVFRLYRNKVKRSVQDVALGQTAGDRKISLQFSEIQVLTIQSSTANQCKEVQTSERRNLPMLCSATETERLSLTTSAQQTIASPPGYTLNRILERRESSLPPPPPLIHFSSKANQTEVNTATSGVQCKFRSAAGATQTDELAVTSSFTQVWVDKQQECQQTAKVKSSEREAVIYMLNEIGELVLNQNHMLSNTTRMLDQITDMTILSKTANLGQAWRNRTRGRASKRYKYSKNQNTLEMESIRNTHSTGSMEKSSKSTQTLEERKPLMVDECSQTTFDLLKSRKFSFLKTQSREK